MKRNLLLTSMFLMLSFFISACSDGDSDGESSPASYPVAEKDNTGSPIDFSNPDSLYGKYQILHYEVKRDGMHVSNNCPDSKCISSQLGEGSKLTLVKHFEFAGQVINTDTWGDVSIKTSNYYNIGAIFLINIGDIVENYTTSKENPKIYSYEHEFDGTYYEFKFNGTYDKDTVGVFKPENDTDKLKIEMKMTNKNNPNTKTWVYLVVKKISDEAYPVDGESYPVAEKDNTGSPIDFSNPDSLYGEYQILHYEQKYSEAHVSNNCPDSKCISSQLGEGSKLTLVKSSNGQVMTDTKGVVRVKLPNYHANSNLEFFINISDIVENYTTSKENPKTFSYSYELNGSDNEFEITFNGTYDKDTVGVFKPENDKDKLKIEMKMTNKNNPNANFWGYLVVKKISNNQN